MIRRRQYDARRALEDAQAANLSEAVDEIVTSFVARLTRGEPAAVKALNQFLVLRRRRELSEAEQLQLADCERILGSQAVALLDELRRTGIIR